MSLITIRERADGAHNAVLSFDHEGEYPITVADPFSEEEEKLLEWYFEDHLRFPFIEQVRASHAAASIQDYGERLFKQVFADNEAYARYKEGVQGGIEKLRFEVAGSPEFHALHWEALKDPRLPKAFALEAPMVRKNLKPQGVKATVQTLPTINLLLVTARPDGGRDVGYRTISRPLIEMLRNTDLRVRVDILRPGTYKALAKHLDEVREERGSGFYHIVHFDLHGALMTYEGLQKGQKADRYLFQARYGREDIAEYEGLKAFLFLEGEQEGQADPVEAAEVADLLMTHQVPIAILNACQSGKQVGEVETSLGSRLMQAGVQMVLAMGYKVTVSAAALLMETLYPELFAGEDLSTAIRRARLELYNQKGRRAYFNQMIDLEDWILPVVYQNRPVHLAVRAFTEEEHKAYYEREAELYEAPTPTYGFHGRDLDVLEIERRLLRHNLLLLRGMGGAGKTTLLRHLGAWWQTTNFVDQVFYFGYDESAWNRQQIMHEIARRLLSGVEFAMFQPMSLNAQQKQLAKKLRAHRHLLILDNMESITGAHLAIQNTLPDDERDDVRRFLAALSGGYTLVLMGSRGGEAWLTGKAGPGNPPIRQEHLYDLPGLDAEAASSLADRILESHDATRYRDDDDYQRLLTLLDGYPLPMEIIFANLARQTPADILEALQAGDEDLDVDLGGKEGGKQKSLLEAKTESILKCIDYSHSNLSPDAQALLTCLAPFTGVVNVPMLETYTEHLKQQPALADLDFDQWQEVLQEAINWGLLSPHEVQGFLRLQPIFPYFLRSRLAEQEQDAWREAVNAAFRALYDGLGREMAGLLKSKKAEEKQMGQVLVCLEYENLSTALDLALAAQESIVNPYLALSKYLDTTQDQRRGLELGEKVLAKLEEYSPEKLSGLLGVEFGAVIDEIARRQLSLKRYTDAEASYQKALSLVKATTAYEGEEKAKLIASVYHQLGRVAEEQRQWPQAEQYYQQALAIKIEFNDRYSQASTYHQLGIVAQAQRQWAQAEQYYQQALAIFVEFNDRYTQASTYHQLGRVAEAQRQWLQAEQYYQQALAIYVEFNDEHSLDIVLRSLARLWKASGDDSIPGAIAPILNEEPAEVEKMLQALIDQSDEDEGEAE